MKGVLSFTDEELVSADFIHNVQLGKTGVFSTTAGMLFAAV